MRTIFFLVLIATLLVSCDNDNDCEKQVDISGIQINIEVERLEGVLRNIKTIGEMKAFLKKNPVVADYFFMRPQYPNDSILADALLKTFANPHIDTLFMEVDQVFSDFSEIKNSFASAFAHIKYYYPDFKIPKIKTVVTGLNHDMHISDSLIVIGLDYYLGKGAKFRPKTYDYILTRYAKEYIVPSCMLLYGISPGYNKTSVKDKTILAEAITYGKSFHFAKRMMPCTPDSVLIWYNTEEIEGVFENQSIIWAHFIEKELLYETNHFIKRKYIDDRPKTYEIGEKCPGRIGTWLGWQIVRKYEENNPDESLQDLMESTDAKQIFQKSNYKP